MTNFELLDILILVGDIASDWGVNYDLGDQTEWLL